jgi:uncharacterized protein (DUF2267 family)
MAMTGLSVFDTTLQNTHTWINDVAAELGWEDKHRAFQGLRIVLHALRDRLTVEEAAHLGAQLPILLSGFYYESWKPATSPTKVRSKDAFLNQVREQLEGIQFPLNKLDVSIEQLVRAVFRVLAQRVTQGEIEDIVKMLPSDLKDLWPQEARI